MRAFVALELPNDVVRMLIEARDDLRATDANVRWVTPGNIHLTLKFFGDIDQDQAERMKRALREAVSLHSAPIVHVGGVGAFPNARNPRVVCVGMDADDHLRNLQEFIESAAEDAGVPREQRIFSPHLTLGRVKDSRGSNLSRLLGEVKTETLTVSLDNLVLFESRLSPQGAKYAALERVVLRDNDEIGSGT